MATTKITNPELFDLGSLNTALKLPSGTTAERPTSPSTGEWRYNTDNNLIEFWDGGAWRDLQDEDLPPVPSENFSAILYTGDGTASNSITGLGFQPDWIFIKRRDAAGSWSNYDSSRGSSKYNFLNSTSTESTSTAYLASFDSDGFTVGSNTAVNTNGATYIAFCCKVNGGTTVTNTDGSANSTVQVNQKTGSSIIQYSASGSDLTYGHGLSQEPNFILVKARTWSNAWFAWLKESGGAQYGGYFDQTAAVSAGNSQVGTPNATTIGANHPGTRNSGDYIVYAFHDVAGYSKFGTYTGNGSTSGPVVNTGFEPAFIILRTANGVAGYNWVVKNNKTSTSNPRSTRLRINLSNAEDTGDDVNFLTNGFEIISSSNDVNLNGAPYIYIAFAADPSTSTPTLANSFNTTTYTGTGTSNSITGLNFSPSLVWIKQRNTARGQNWYDVLRGPENLLLSNGSGAASQEPAGTTLGSFDTDGFTVGTGSGVNQSGGTYVSWNWKANTIPTINTDGTVQTIVSVNANAGFSIIKFTTPSPTTTSDSFGHGLSVAPELIIVKSLTNSAPWYTYHKDLGQQYHVNLNTTDAVLGPFTSMFNPVNSDSFLFRPSSISQTYISYAFHSVSGYSKIGSYTGNGTTNAITGFGFQPDWILAKRTDVADNWAVINSVTNTYLLANLSDAEATYTWFAFTSDGFTLSTSTLNASGGNYIYMAFKIN